MFNKMLTALLLVATVGISWAESALSHDSLLNRHRRAIDEQSKWVNYGSVGQHYKNNYHFDGKSENGGGSQDSSVITGSVTNQDKNSYSNIDQADNVYLVLPHWYSIANQQTPSAVHRSLGTYLTPQRSQAVREKIDKLKRTCKEIHDGVKLIESTNHRGFDHMFEKATQESSNKSSKLNILFHKCETLMARLKYQEVRLRQFSDETLPMQDIFDADLAHLKTMLEKANLELMSLQAS